MEVEQLPVLEVWWTPVHPDSVSRMAQITGENMILLEEGWRAAAHQRKQQKIGTQHDV